MNLTLLYWIVIAVMVVGVVGAVLPVIPGPSLILVALLIWYGATGFANMGWPLVAIFLILILSAAVEYLATYWGAKTLGASKWAQYGAIAGLALGFFGLLPALPFGGPLVGLLFGPVIGAFIGEFLYQKDLTFNPRLERSAKASLGVVIGSALGNLLEGILALAAVAIFVLNTWPIVRSLPPVG